MGSKNLFAISLLIAVSSCNIHQYVSYSSELPKNEKGIYSFSDDSLSISYRFTGKNVLEIELTNQTETLVFVDWNKSSIIYGDLSLPFVDNIATMSGTTTSTEYINGASYGNIKGTIEESSSKTYIPPKSKSIRQFTKLPTEYINRLKQNYPYEQVQLPSDAKKFKFSDTSPLSQIKTYIVFSSSDEKNSKQFTHDFWVSEIIQTMDGSLQSQPDQLKLTKKTATGAIMSTAGLLALLAVAIATDDSSDSSEL